MPQTSTVAGPSARAVAHAIGNRDYGGGIQVLHLRVVKLVAIAELGGARATERRSPSPDASAVRSLDSRGS